MARDPARLGEAAAWLARTADPAFDDWDGFAAWLGRHPDNLPAYDTVAFAVDVAAEALRPLPCRGDDS